MAPPTTRPSQPTWPCARPVTRSPSLMSHDEDDDLVASISYAIENSNPGTRYRRTRRERGGRYGHVRVSVINSSARSMASAKSSPAPGFWPSYQGGCRFRTQRALRGGTGRSPTGGTSCPERVTRVSGSGSDELRRSVPATSRHCAAEDPGLPAAGRSAPRRGRRTTGGTSRGEASSTRARRGLAADPDAPGNLLRRIGLLE